MLVPRRARQFSGSNDASAESPIRNLPEFRNQAAWVLLGEPGAGKSEIFKEEAKACGGVYISIAEFLSDEPKAGWQGRTLFLDGLDETRASGGDKNILFEIRAHLRKLAFPPFRIACRAADWFGSTDREDIQGASPDGLFAVLVLEPLSEAEVLSVLRENHGIATPESFVGKACEYGLDGLLSNPQTLKLLAETIQDGQWPKSRQETYQLACEKLAQEDSKRHRVKSGSQQFSVDSLIDSAGQLCAVLLLSDKAGLALDIDAVNERFPPINELAPPDLSVARLSAKSKIFRPAAEGEERFVPSHRSIAEFLAARWLARQIDLHGLPLRRILNLLLGRDGRTVAGLRGLYGWLALHCKEARPHLIEADALTVIVYGDVRPMSKSDKKCLLDGLRKEAEQHIAFRWEIRSATPFGALADRDLVDDFTAILKSPKRDDASQSFVDCILAILNEGEALPELADPVKELVLDSHCRAGIREAALEVWLRLASKPQEAITLLDAISQGKIADPDDQLAGQLLRHLYPAHIRPDCLMQYLHEPKNQRRPGRFGWFWSYELPNIVPESDVPILLDQLAECGDPASEIFKEFDLARMVSRLLAKGIESYGERIGDERLFAWLGVGADQYGSFRRESDDQTTISDWLQNHPDRYKALLSLCYQRSEPTADRWDFHFYEQRLHGAVPPEDIGLWHLAMASTESNEFFAENHLSNAVHALIYRRGAAGLSLEKIEAWGEAHPQRKRWLERMLSCEILTELQESRGRSKARKEQLEKSKAERSLTMRESLDAIRAAQANPGLLHQLAGVWMDHYSDTHGETPLARFESYCDNADEVLAAAEAGFFLCPVRADLPSVLEIIALSIKQQEHFIRKPCLIGMELRWRRDVRLVADLDDDVLGRMLAFRLTYGADNTPEWFTYLVEQRPTLVAEVLVEYATRTMKAGRDFVSGTYALAHDPNYRNLALAAVPALLQGFPVRAKALLLSHLEYLLKSALNYAMPSLPGIIEQKLVAKSMDSAQKVYWLTAGMLVDPGMYETQLWRYIGKSWTRANGLCAFLDDRFNGLSSDYSLSALTIGRLIEMLTPHAELSQPSGLVSAAMQRGENIRTLITRLGGLANDEAEREIERLLALPSLKKLQYWLDNARRQLKLKQRENAFRFPALSEVAQIVANKEPTNAADLAALALDHLDTIAQNIQGENSDLFRHFWTETAPNNAPKPENSCRDFLLDKLRGRLDIFGINSSAEADQFNDKRADILLSFQNRFELPIEIKRDDNRSLWTALRTQLIAQYTKSSKSAGHGIYLILWFGGKDLPAAKDGGKKPLTPDELQTRLEAQLDAEERQRVFVRVLDVSWPLKS
ncbi:MAG: hypothetical protein WAV95_15235 [Azonexus sp.]